VSRAPASSTTGPGHIEACRVETFWDAYEKFKDEGYPRPVDEEWARQAGIQVCAEGCPTAERSKALGRVLAAKYGW
jgi:hypothetical protein